MLYSKPRNNSWASRPATVTAMPLSAKSVSPASYNANTDSVLHFGLHVSLAFPVITGDAIIRDFRDPAAARSYGCSDALIWVFSIGQNDSQ